MCRTRSRSGSHSDTVSFCSCSTTCRMSRQTSPPGTRRCSRAPPAAARSTSVACAPRTLHRHRAPAERTLRGSRLHGPPRADPPQLPGAARRECRRAAAPLLPPVPSSPGTSMASFLSRLSEVAAPRPRALAQGAIDRHRRNDRPADERRDGLLKSVSAPHPGSVARSNRLLLVVASASDSMQNPTGRRSPGPAVRASSAGAIDARTFGVRPRVRPRRPPARRQRTDASAGAGRLQRQGGGRPAAAGDPADAAGGHRQPRRRHAATGTAADGAGRRDPVRADRRLSPRPVVRPARPVPGAASGARQPAGTPTTMSSAACWANRPSPVRRPPPRRRAGSTR